MSSAGQIVGGLVGAVAGFFAGGNVMLGAQIGMTLGGLVDPPKGPTIEGPRLSDLTVQTSTYGAFIGRIKGSVSVAGNVFWLENNAIKEVRTKKKSGGKGGAGKTTTKTYSYFATFALGLGDTSDGNPYASVRRIWIGPDLYYDAGSSDPATVAASNAAASTFAFYNGDESQGADPRIQAALGAANTPAWRGLSYIVFYDLPLAKHNNSLAAAQVRVEVMQRGITYLYPYQTFTMPSSQTWRAGAWDGTVFCAVAASNHVVAVSADGLTWQQVALPDSASSRTGVASDGNGTLLVHGISSTGSIWRSVDHGQTWAKVHTAWEWIDHIAWSGNGFLATGSGSVVRTSPDGITWTAQTFPVGGTYFSRTPLWHEASGHWYVVTQDGAHPRIYRSPTGATGTWSLVYTMAGDLNNFGFGCVHNGRILFNGIGTGSSGYGNMMVWSDDGVTWGQANVPSREYWILSDGDNVWVGDGGTTGSCYYSADGVTGWSYYDGPNQGVNHEAVYGNFSIVAVPSGNNQGFLITKQFSAPLPVALGEIVAAECLQSGILTAADIDVTALTQPVHGYRVGSLGSIRSALEPLQAAWPFDIVQAGYKIKFVPRGGAAVATIAAGDLGASADADKPEVQITMPRESDPVLPRRVTVQYLDIDREYETGEQHLERANTSAVGHRVAELPIVMTADEAAGKAETLLYQAWLDRVSVSFSLPGTYGALEPADVVNLPTPEGTIAVRIEAIEYTSDGRLQCKARPSQPAIYTPAAVGAPSLVTPPATIAAAGPCTYRLLDIPYLLPQQSGPTLLAAMCGQLAGWPGGALMQSADGGSTWAELAFFDAPGATFGLASNTIGVVDHRLVDHTSVLAVTLIVGDLFNCTELAMLGGSNLFAYGAEGRWEICAARTCTLQSGKSYLLRDMLRGLYGTEWAMGTHAVGDALILLDSSDVQAIPMTTGLIGLSRDYRGITAGADISTDGSRAYAYQAINLKPLSPVNLTGHRDPSTNDWTLSAVRRTRVGGEWRDGVDAELGEATEAYDWEIYADGTFTTVKRVLTTSSPQCAYPSASQVADFGSNQMTLYVKLYQLSATVGRGYPLTATITR